MARQLRTRRPPDSRVAGDSRSAESPAALIPAETLARIAAASTGEAQAEITSWPPGVAEQGLRVLARTHPEAALNLLRGLAARPPRPELAAPAVEALGGIRSVPAAEVLQELAETLPGRELRKQARRALHRLSQAGIRPPERAPTPQPVAPAQRTGIYRAYTTLPDGTGSREVVLGLQLPMQGRYLAVAHLNEAAGLQDFAATRMTQRRFERYVAELAEQDGLLLTQIPAEWAQRLLADAVAANRRSGHPIPLQFSTFRDAIGQARPDVQPPIYNVLSETEVRLRPDLLERSPSLLELPEFAGWLLDPDDIRPQAEEWRRAREGPIALPPSAVEERQRRALDAVIDAHLSGEAADRLRRRLEEVGWAFYQHGRQAEARVAVAAAATLRPDGGIPPRQHPFIRAIAASSLQFAAAPAHEEVPERRSTGLIIPR